MKENNHATSDRPQCSWLLTTPSAGKNEQIDNTVPTTKSRTRIALHNIFQTQAGKFRRKKTDFGFALQARSRSPPIVTKRGSGHLWYMAHRSSDSLTFSLIEYLHKIGKLPSPECPGCHNVRCPGALCLLYHEAADLPEHVLLRCGCLGGVRHNMFGTIYPVIERLRDGEVVAALTHGYRYHQEPLATRGLQPR